MGRKFEFFNSIQKNIEQTPCDLKLWNLSFLSSLFQVQDHIESQIEQVRSSKP